MTTNWYTRSYALFLIFSLISFTNTSFAQVPFVCDGSGYIVTEKSGESILTRLEHNAVAGTVILHELGKTRTELNGIGYRPADNYIYGVHPSNFGLYRVDATAATTLLKTLPLTQPFYTSGDVSIDGNSLVIVGYNQANTKAMELVYVDLSGTDFNITNTIDISALDIRFYDMAFDPLTNHIYGFDYTNSRLFKMNSVTGAIVASYASTSQPLNIGSLFFDQFGNLFGYGGVQGLDQTKLYKFDVTDGTATLVASGPTTTKSDGCSCSSSLGLTKEADNKNVEACETVAFTYTIYNQTPIVQSLTLIDTMPMGFEISSISGQGAATIVSGVGSNRLHLNDLSAALGTSEVIVTVTMSGVSGSLGSQARLQNIPSSMGFEKLSDDPETGESDDSTFVNVFIAESEYFYDTLIICEGNQQVLEAQNPNSSKYVWSTGATTNEISVTQGGDYWVMEIGNCDSIFTYYNVIIHSVDVTITPGHILGKIGEVIDLSSNVSHTSSGSIDYQWSASNSILLCNSCENSQVELQSNGSVNLMVQDSFGCISQASITIEIDRSPDFHIPSGFSPNGDGLNDVFYVVGDGYLIENFSVYDRWGGKQFEVIDGYSGNPEHGWDASNITERGMNSTVFMYVARISDPDGFTHHVSGTIHLIR